MISTVSFYFSHSTSDTPRGGREIAAFFAWILTAGAALAQGPPAGYYDTIDTSSPDALRSTLHETIDDHQRFPYTSSNTDTWDILEEAQEHPTDPARIIDVY